MGRATDLESTVIKYYEQIVANSDSIKHISEITSDLKNKTQFVDDKVDEQKNALNTFELNQNERNKSFTQELITQGERFDKVESGMKNSLENVTRQYREVDEKIAMIINDKFENLQKIIGSYETKNKDTIQYMQDLTDRTSNLEQSIENKFSVMDEKDKELLSRLNSLQESNNLQNQKVDNLEVLGDKVNHIDDTMKVFEANYNAMMANINKYESRAKKIDDSMNAIMEQANTTLINDAQQDAKIKNLETLNRNFENKLSSLESADLYLQESYRQLTDKTIKIETDFRKTDDNLNFLYKQQQEEIEGKIKAQ